MKHDDETLQAAIDAAMLGLKTGTQHKSLDTYRSDYWPKESPARLALAKAFLAKLPEAHPILADDGRSLGEVCADAALAAGLNRATSKECDEAAAQAVAFVVLAQAIRRMEAVPVKELKQIWYQIEAIDEGLDTVRARLIAAARGESEQPDTTDWKARAEKAEAQVADMLESLESKERVYKQDSEYLESRLYKAEAELAALKSAQLGILRPLSEAGPVPDGCVRVTGLKDCEDKWAIGDSRSQHDTHFADIRLPVTETPAQTVNEQPKQQVPLGPEDVMPGSVFRLVGADDESAWQQPHEILCSGAAFHNGGGTVMWKDWSYLASRFEINRSIPMTGKWDANAWEPCYKLV